MRSGCTLLKVNPERKRRKSHALKPACLERSRRGGRILTNRGEMSGLKDKFHTRCEAFQLHVFAMRVLAISGMCGKAGREEVFYPYIRRPG
jgi:hypothetical protein